MADTAISALSALGAQPASTDLIPLVDVSDTTMSGNGTTKSVTYAYLTTGLLTDITGESIGDLSDVTLTTPAQGDILYHNGTAWVNLAAGTSGQYLQTQGAAANPQWATLSGGGDMATATYDPATISEQLVGLTATQTLTNKTLTQPTITLKQGAAPAPTAEGDIQWDTDDNKLKVGDGAATKTFSDDSYNTSTFATASHAHGAADITSGTLAHERGGIEADISAISTGGILAGTGAGTMGIVSASGKSDGDVLTLQADGTVAYETPAAGGGGGGPRGFTYVVASSTSRDTTGADAVCDGTADDVEIQAAINAVNTAGGGTVLMLDGTYNIATVVTAKSNVRLMGQGYGTKWLRAGAVQFIGFGTASVVGFECTGIRFDGGSQTQYGIIDGGGGYADFGRIHGCWFLNFSGANEPVYIGASDYFRVENCVFNNVTVAMRGYMGCVFSNNTVNVDTLPTISGHVVYGAFAGSTTAKGMTVSNNVFNCNYVSSYNQIKTSGGDIITNNKFIGTGYSSNGLIRAGNNNLVQGNIFGQIDNGSGINVYNWGTIVKDNIFGGTLNGGTIKAIHVEGNGDWAVVDGNVFYTGSGIGVQVDAGIEMYQVTNNRVYGDGFTGTVVSIPNMSSTVFGTAQNNYGYRGSGSVNTVVEQMNNSSGGTINPGEVVVRSTSSTTGKDVTTTTTAGNANAYGIAVVSHSASTNRPILTKGLYSAAKVDGSGTSVAVGDYLMTSTTAGKMVKATAGNTVIAIARAAVTTDTTALVEVIEPRLI